MGLLEFLGGATDAATGAFNAYGQQQANALLRQRQAEQDAINKQQIAQQGIFQTAQIKNLEADNARASQEWADKQRQSIRQDVADGLSSENQGLSRLKSLLGYVPQMEPSSTIAGPFDPQRAPQPMTEVNPFSGLYGLTQRTAADKSRREMDARLAEIKAQGTNSADIARISASSKDQPKYSAVQMLDTEGNPVWGSMDVHTGQFTAGGIKAAPRTPPKKKSDKDLQELAKFNLSGQQPDSFSSPDEKLKYGKALIAEYNRLKTENNAGSQQDPIAAWAAQKLKNRR